MGLYRLYQSGEATAVGVIVAKNKPVAEAFAQGAYGAGASAVRVNYKDVLESGAVCVVLSTEMRMVNSNRSVRVVS